MRLATFLFCASLLAPLSLDAQAPGERVRITLAARPAAAGTVVRAGTDGLVLRAAGADMVRAAWPEVRRLDVSLGASRTRSMLRGTGIGLLAGAATGAVLGFATYHEDENGGGCYPICSRSGSALYAGAVLGAVGGVAGALSGAIWPRERWRRSPLPVSIAAARDGVAVGARVGF